MPPRADEPAALRAATALALALAVAPLLLLLPLDADRALPLAFAPALWLARDLPGPGTARPVAWLALWALLGLLLSTALSEHVARAVVMGSAALWTATGALVACRLAPLAAARRRILLGLFVGAVLGQLLVRAGAGWGWMSYPIYGSARLHGGHQAIGCLAGLALLAPTPGGLAARVALVFGNALVWTGLAWSGARAPALGLAVALVLWFWRAAPPARKTLLRWVPALAATGLALSLAWGTPYPQMGWRQAATRTAAASSVEEITSERTSFWRVTWDYALERPWSGHGADGYRFMVPPQHGSQPHNAPLQWMVEYGLFGATPLLLLLGLGVGNGLRRRAPDHAPADADRLWASAALGGLCVNALFDGVFYHTVLFMPAAVIAGWSLGLMPGRPQSLPARRAPAAWLLAPVAVSTALAMLLHNTLSLALLRLPKPAPEALAPRLLWHFPSTTHGLQNWLSHWRAARPEVLPAWLAWAETASTEPAVFHLYAVQMHLDAGDFFAAEKELRLCLGKVRDIERADTQRLLDAVAERARRPPPPSAPPLSPDAR